MERHEQRSDVLHVRELTLVERGRAVGQGRPLEQHDPFGARLDRLEAEQRELLALPSVNP